MALVALQDRASRLVVANRHVDRAAALLADLEPPEFPTALGVFRQVERPTYDHLMTQQIGQTIAKRGRGDLRALLNAGTTWAVD